MAGVDTPQVQRQVDTLLRRGFVFSIVWLGGIGSLVAILSGVKAKRLIVESGGEVTGLSRVGWCLIVGGLGLLLWGPIILISVINNIAGR